MPPIIARFQLAYQDFQLDVDLTLPGSGISVLFGHSGSGKTTLLRCIAGLQKATQGFLQINGTIWQDHQRQLFLPTHQRALGYVFQEANLFVHLSVAQNLQYGLKRIPEGAARADVAQIIALLGIEHLLQRMPQHLSGGERQRVAIARALVLNPSVLLMDEPLAALDSQRKQELLPYFMRLQQALQIPMLYVTHSLQEVAQLADHLVILEAGKVQAAGPLSAILSRLDLPGVHARQASSVWQGVISRQENEYSLTHVSFDQLTLCLSKIDAAVGTPVRVQIFASDVSITLEHPKASSILNILPAIVDDIHSSEANSVLRLRLDTQLLLAHITNKSRALLNLQLGMPVYVQIKGTSILN